MHIIFGIIAMIGFGLASGIAKGFSNRIGSDQTIFWSRLLVIPVLVMLVIIAGVSIDRQTGMSILVLGVIGYLPLYWFYRSLAYGDVGVLGTFASTATLITIVLSVLILGERLGVMTILGILGVFVGVFMIGLEGKSLSVGLTPKALGYVGGAIVGWGVVYFGFKIAVDASTPLWTALLVESGVLLGAMIHYLIQCKPFPKFTTESSLRRGFVWMIAVSTIGGIAFNYGLELGPVPVVASLFSGSVIVTALYGMIVYGEVLKAKQWLGIGLVVLGLVLVSGVV